VYIVSSVSITLVRSALKNTLYRALGKEEFLGEEVRARFPFEVLAAIDFGVAAHAPLYFGEPSMRSSFDAFADAQRKLLHRTAMRPMGEAVYCAGASSRR
jgi:hypothetical protein